MKLTILIDNTPDWAGRLNFEHGLSIYAESCGRRILVDTGLSGKAFDNARSLGIDISKVEYLFLSHGHKDHTGGLGRFLEENHDGKIVSSRKIMELDYTSCSRGTLHSLNPDRDVIIRNKDRFVFLDYEPLLIMDGDNRIVASVSTEKKHPRPNGNRMLHINGQPYAGDDELAISVVEDGRMSIISPCTHSGIMNIEECCRRLTGMDASCFVGGLHFVDGENDVEGGAMDGCKIPQIYTGHCTGNEAKNRLTAILGERLSVFRTGDVIYC